MRCLVLIYFNGERYVIGRYGFFTIIVQELNTVRHAQGLFSTNKTVQRRRLTDEHEQHDDRHTPSPIKIG